LSLFLNYKSNLLTERGGEKGNRISLSRNGVARNSRVNLLDFLRNESFHEYSARYQRERDRERERERKMAKRVQTAQRVQMHILSPTGLSTDFRHRSKEKVNLEPRDPRVILHQILRKKKI